MLKKLLVILAMLYASVAFAAVDVNKATAAELDGVKGIGPVTSKAIMDERKKGAFKDWADLIARVKGVGEGNAAKYSAEGLTVNGAAYKAAAATKKEDKKEAKAAAKEDKKEVKAAAKDEKAGKKEEKKEEKAAAKDAKKDAKEDKKEAKKDEKAAAAKPAASAKK
jgi:competence protein ComEA